jgi:hypothetical protein
MLGQLVCIDRRYQRMNCFNIRETQSLLKRKFFHDLVLTTDHRELLDHTTINLRYQISDISTLNSATFLINQFNLNPTAIVRGDLYSDTSSISQPTNHLNYFLYHFINTYYINTFLPDFLRCGYFLPAQLMDLYPINGLWARFNYFLLNIFFGAKLFLFNHLYYFFSVFFGDFQFQAATPHINIEFRT